MNQTRQPRTGKGAVVISVGRVAMVLVAVGQAVIIPRVLGPTNMGFYSYWVSIFFTLGSVFQLGATETISRHVPQLRVQDPAAIRPLLDRLLVIRLPVVAAACAIGAGVFYTEWSYYLAICIGAGVFSVLMMLLTVFYAHHRMGMFISMPLVRSLTKVGLLLWLFPLLGRWGILAAVLGSTALVTVVVLVALRSLLPPGEQRERTYLQKYTRFGLWLYIGMLAGVLMSRLVVIMARYYVSDLALVGYLGFALQAVYMVAPVAMSVGAAVLPSLVRSYSLGNPDADLIRSVALTWKYTNLLMCPIMAVIWALSRPAVEVLVGREFGPAVPLIQWLVPVILLRGWAHVHRQILLLFERRFTLLAGSLVQLGVFLILMPLLLARMGILGGPLTLVCVSVVGYVYAVTFSARLKWIPRYALNLGRPAAASVAAVVVMSLIPVSELATLAMAGALGMAVYAGVLWVTGGIGRRDFQRLAYHFAS